MEYGTNIQKSSILPNDPKFSGMKSVKQNSESTGHSRKLMIGRNSRP